MNKTSFKERQNFLRQENILAVARRIFAEKGFHGTNLNDVASEVGIARGTIYLHFPTKEELLAAIISRAEQELLETLKQAVDPVDSPLEKLRKALFALLKTYGEYEDLIKVMSDDLRRVVSGKLYGPKETSPVPELVQSIIEEGKTAGLINPQINTKVAANALFSIVTIGTFRELVVNGRVTEEEIIDSAIHLYFNGITVGGIKHE